MSPNDQVDLLSARVVVPEHVVQRAFQGETVALNLQSGQYHGLNAVAARMVEELRRVSSVRDAIAPLAAEFGQPHDVIERDLTQLVRDLDQRGLLELHASDGG